MAAVFEWTTPEGDPRREVDVLVAVDGDLSAPELEWDKHVEYRWLAEDELDVLDEHRVPDDETIRRVVAAGFELLR